MKLYLVRHGESTANQYGVHNREDEQLTQRGVTESKAVAAHLAAVRFDIVYVSPLLRARQTAAAIMMRHDGVHVLSDTRLRERDSGVYAGSPHGTIDAAAREAGVIYEEFRASGGESLRDMEQRAQQFIQELVKLHSELKNVLIVSHAGPIAAMLRLFMVLTDGTVSASAVRNGSITLLDTDHPDVVTIFADVSHLSGIDSSR
jgi:broad specificity phosphatase PhoE